MKAFNEWVFNNLRTDARSFTDDRAIGLSAWNAGIEYGTPPQLARNMLVVLREMEELKAENAKLREALLESRNWLQHLNQYASVILIDKALNSKPLSGEN